MSHHRYETKGFILGRRPYGESALILSVLSRDFGVVPVLAQGARDEYSKHRMSLMVAKPLEISLVRGREWWRLVGIRCEDPTGMIPAKQKLLERLATIIRHYVHGELSQPELFEVFTEAWNLPDNHFDDADKLLTIECLLVARLLSVLGYLSLPTDWQNTMTTKQLLVEINACLTRGIN